VRAELKTIGTADINASATLSWWCRLSDKLNILVEPHHARQFLSYFLVKQHSIKFSTEINYLHIEINWNKSYAYRNCLAAQVTNYFSASRTRAYIIDLQIFKKVSHDFLFFVSLKWNFCVKTMICNIFCNKKACSTKNYCSKACSFSSCYSIWFNHHRHTWCSSLCTDYAKPSSGVCIKC